MKRRQNYIAFDVLGKPEELALVLKSDVRFLQRFYLLLCMYQVLSILFLLEDYELEKQRDEAVISSCHLSQETSI